MSQDAVSNSTQETSLSGGGGNSTSTGFASGTVCQSSGTYKSENRYMTTVQLYAAGEIFRVGTDGKKCTWYPLTRTAESGFDSSDGSFTSVKVEAGTV